jgi:hypothetical protein
VSTVRDVLVSRFPAALVDAVLSSYKEIEENYLLGKWKASELDAGHFTEAVRRIIEEEVLGKHTALGKSLPSFSQAELKKYENGSCDESFRILLPRVLYGVYGIRNKRGVGHLGVVSPNEMDATLILYSVKWVLAELVRLASGLSTSETQALVDGLVERKLSVIWKHDGITRILNSSTPARDQVLVLLYDKSPQTEDELRESIKYQNKSKFKTILKGLDSKNFIARTPAGLCIISPKGVIQAESIIKKIDS